MPSRIEVNPEIHFGKPCIVGTRIPVQSVLELVSEGIPFTTIIEEYYPDLQIEDIRACIQYAIELVAEKLKKAVNIAEHNGIMLVLENCPHTYIQRGNTCRQVIELMDSHAIRALWDPGNALRKGFEPYPSDYESIKNYIAHIHLKDYASGYPEKPVPFGQGIIDYERIIKSEDLSSLYKSRLYQIKAYFMS